MLWLAHSLPITLPGVPLRRRPGSTPRSRAHCGSALLQGTFWGLLLTLLVPSTARAQTPADRRPSVAPTRLSAGQGIEIDGRLDEPAWTQAAQIGRLTQVQPIEGARPTKQTRVRLAYDSDFLYLAIECFDDPEVIRARQMDRDANVRFDDVVEWWIDTFDDQRFAFWFQITPAGSRGDALLADNGSSFNKDWDGIWYGRALITEQGWQAEIALPFQTLSFRPGLTQWGFNLVRKRKENDEESRWASPYVAYRFFRTSEGGKLTGLTGMNQGLGLDVVPYAKGQIISDRAGGDDTSLLGDIGLDVNYRITPSLSWRTTFNTDFAETEVDARQVNLTRFPLFFPEKRDFFLEDAGLFEFGSPDRRSQLVPFFSRTVGRDEEGKAVPILAGTKLTGRAGPWNIGAIGTLIDENDELAEKGLGTLRISRNLGGEQSLGMIATAGAPNQRGRASTVGLDFRLGDTRAFGTGRAGSLWGYWLNTQREGPGGEGHAYGLRGELETSTWEHEFASHHTEAGFNPELGFVRRTNVREYRWRSEYTWRNQEGGTIRRATWNVRPVITTELDGDKDIWSVPLRWLDLTFDSEDSIQIESRRLFERIEESFEIGDVDVTPGDYTMTRHTLRLESNNRRLVAGEVEVEAGDFFSGDLLRYRLAPILILNKFFTFSVGYEKFDVDLDEGDFDTQVIDTRFDFTFNPDLSWRNLIQYDDDTDTAGLQSRMHWIISPGHDFFLVGLFGWEEKPDDSIVPTDQDLTLKISYTFRF